MLIILSFHKLCDQRTDSKETRIEIEKISIRREIVRSMSNWRRSGNLCYLATAIGALFGDIIGPLHLFFRHPPAPITGITFRVIRLTHGGLIKVAAILQTKLSNAISWTSLFEFWIQFHWRFWLTVHQNLFRLWLGAFKQKANVDYSPWGNMTSLSHDRLARSMSTESIQT